MKKLAAVFAAAVMVFTIIACAEGRGENTETAEVTVISRAF